MSKRTLENCSVIQEAISIGAGRPEQYDGKCEGYAGENRDEPITRCSMCDFNTTNNE